MKRKIQPPPRRPELLTEAVVNIPDGTSITDWLRDVEKAAIQAVAGKLPPAPVDERGRYPDQWLRMVDARPEEVVICVSRWGGPEDSFQTHFRVPFTSAEDGTVTVGEPVEVEVEFRMVYTDVAPEAAPAQEAPPPAPAADRSAAISEAVTKLRAKVPGAVELAEGVLRDVSGKHPLAGTLAVELSRARA